MTTASLPHLRPLSLGELLDQRIVQALLKQMNVPSGPMDERRAESLIVEIVQAARNRLSN